MGWGCKLQDKLPIGLCNLKIDNLKINNSNIDNSKIKDSTDNWQSAGNQWFKPTTEDSKSAIKNLTTIPPMVIIKGVLFSYFSKSITCAKIKLLEISLYTHNGLANKIVYESQNSKI